MHKTLMYITNPAVQALIVASLAVGILSQAQASEKVDVATAKNGLAVMIGPKASRILFDALTSVKEEVLQGGGDYESYKVGKNITCKYYEDGHVFVKSQTCSLALSNSGVASTSVEWDFHYVDSSINEEGSMDVSIGDLGVNVNIFGRAADALFDSLIHTTFRFYGTPGNSTEVRVGPNITCDRVVRPLEPTLTSCRFLVLADGTLLEELH